MTDVEPHEKETEPAAVRRSLLGKSAALWSSHGEHEVEPGWWKAMSGARSVDFNVLLCHGADLRLVKRSLDCVADAKNPAMINLAGPGLAGAQILNDGGWVCIGASPIMVLENVGDLALRVDPDVVEVGPAHLPGVWDAVSETFQLSPALVRVAIPEDVFETAGQSLWTLSVDGSIRSCVATVVVDSSLMVWSMATLPAWQRLGYGRRLLTTALARNAAQGVTESILLSSPAGEPMYRVLGYEVSEYWQQWSRPRWVFGRS
jgi:GNAT superfamily N-acetyltransferase